MNKVKIRQANEEDIKAIENMVFEWLKWKRKRVKTIIKVLKSKDHLILVAELDSQIIGILHMIFYLDIVHGATNCHINLLLVKEDYRGKGIGKNLLNEAVKLAKKKNVVEIHVDTIFEDAAKFYRKFGFKDDGVWLEFPLEQ